jgi:HEAT repeat protein
VEFAAFYACKSAEEGATKANTQLGRGKLGLFGPNVKKLYEKRDVSGLCQALKHKNAEIRWKAAIALGDIKDPRSVAPLIEALKGESLPIRSKAAIALGEMKDPRAVAPLVQAMKDTDEYWREYPRKLLRAVNTAVF